MKLGRRAVADVVAVLFMITITVAGFTIFYLYAVGLFGPLQGVQVQQPYVDRISLEFYDWTNPAVLKTEIRNVGSSNIVIRAVYIAANNVTGLTWGNGCLGGNLPIQSTCLVQLTAPGGLTRGISYSVILATAHGARVKFSATVGQIG